MGILHEYTTLRCWCKHSCSNFDVGVFTTPSSNAHVTITASSNTCVLTTPSIVILYYAKDVNQEYKAGILGIYNPLLHLPGMQSVVGPHACQTCATRWHAFSLIVFDRSDESSNPIRFTIHNLAMFHKSAASFAELNYLCNSGIFTSEGVLSKPW